MQSGTAGHNWIRVHIGQQLRAARGNGDSVHARQGQAGSKSNRHVRAVHLRDVDRRGGGFPNQSFFPPNFRFASVAFGILRMPAHGGNSGVGVRGSLFRASHWLLVFTEGAIADLE